MKSGVVLTVAFAIFSVSSHADDGIFRSPIPLFQSEAQLKVEMSGNFPTIEKEEVGTFSYTLGQDSHRFAVQFSPRGHFRRTICDTLPPFRIQFAPEVFKNTIFEGAQSEFKLVTQCQSPYDPEYAEKMFMEYTLYRVLNAAGLPSFLPRLLDASYRDANGQPVTAGPAYLLESTKDLIFRRGYRGEDGANSERVNAQIEISHLIVRNADYNVNSEQNAKAVRNNKEEVIAFIPYDFDQSDLIVGDTYFKNVGVDWDDFSRLSELLRPYSVEVKDTLRLILRHESEIILEIEKSPVQAQNKEKLTKRMIEFFAAARRILE